MYRVQRRSRGGLWLVLLLVLAFAVGIGIGYVSIRADRQKEQTPQVLTAQDEPIASQNTPEPNRPASALIEVPTQAPSASPEATPQAEDDLRYFVAEEGGVVCVFTVDAEGTRRFSHKLSIELDALKEADRALFREGLFVESKQALLELIEDFSS